MTLNYITFVISATVWVIFYFMWNKYYAIITHEPSPITQLIHACILGIIRKVPIYSIWPDAIICSVSPRLYKLISPIIAHITERTYRILINY